MKRGDKVFVNCVIQGNPYMDYTGPGIFVRRLTKKDPTWGIHIIEDGVKLVEVKVPVDPEPCVFELHEVNPFQTRKRK